MWIRLLKALGITIGVLTLGMVVSVGVNSTLVGLEILLGTIPAAILVSVVLAVGIILIAYYVLLDHERVSKL